MSESSPGRGQPQPPPPVRSPGAQSQAQDGQSERRRHRGPRNPRSGNQTNSFQGKEEKLKGHVFDVLPYKSGKLFPKVPREIAEYAGRKYPTAGDFRIAMEELEPVQLDKPEWTPAVPTAPMLPEQEEYKLAMKEYYDKKIKTESTAKRIYALVIGQCSPAMKDRLEGSHGYDSINKQSDPIKLLKLIRDSM